MVKRDHIIIAALILVIIILGMIIVTNLDEKTEAPVIKTYRETITNSSDEPGTVEVIRNIGDPGSQKIAYVVGVHPLENLTHRTLVKMLPNMTGLNYCYDIYIINVTEDVGHYGDNYNDEDNPGRQNGQNLAYEYVYPEIADGDYELAIDVHSNVGAYDYKTFVFSPVNGGKGAEYAQNVSQDCENITYYAPSSTTSGPYLTIPLNENGVPAFYFEEYSFSSQDEKDMHMLELINAVDNLEFD